MTTGNIISYAIEFVGSALGMIGGWLVSGIKADVTKIRLGFFVWLISDILLVILGLILMRPFFTLMMGYYCVTSWRGIKNNSETKTK